MKVLGKNPLSSNADEEYVQLAIRSNSGLKAWVDGTIVDLSVNSKGDLVIHEHKPEVFMTRDELNNIKEQYG